MLLTRVSCLNPAPLQDARIAFDMFSNDGGHTLDAEGFSNMVNALQSRSPYFAHMPVRTGLKVG